LSADPIPITEPLVAACLATLSAGLFSSVGTALTAVSTARLGALSKESRARWVAGVERAAQHHETVNGRYLTGRVISTAVAVSGYTLWLSGLAESTRVTFTLAGAGLLALGAILHGSSLIGRRASDRVLLYGLSLLRPLELLVAPVALVMRSFTMLFPQVKAKPDQAVTETEVELMINQRERAGQIEHDPAELIRNVLEFSEMTARDAMVPRKHVNAIRLGTPLEKVVQIITKTGHSRYPVFREDIDDVFGLLYAKDLFQLLSRSWRPPARGEDTRSVRAAQLMPIVREPIRIVSESSPLSVMLREMRQQREHMAVVVDEYGTFTGVLTLEDILEEIVGDIQDEHDPEEQPIVVVAPGRLLADAAIPLEELSDYLGEDFESEGQYETLGGMLTDKMGEVPEVGTTIGAFGLHFIVRESDAKHIAKVEIVVGPPAEIYSP
jgi:putative hemolysin